MQKSTIITIVAAVGGLLVGTGLGASAPADPAPAVTVTATPAPAPTVTVTTEVETQSVSAECLDALEAGDEVSNIARDMANLVAQHLQDEGTAFGSLGNGDWSALETYIVQMEEFNADIRALTDRVVANNYQGKRILCGK